MSPKANHAPRPRSGAAMHRGSSRQDWGTPPEFLEAVRSRFGGIDWDLAAHRANHVATLYLGPGSHYSEDALSADVDWRRVLGEKSNGWLNPPFADIAPWARRCEALRFRAAWTLLLVPASVGTAWWAAHVHNKAMAFWLSPRLTFVGADQGYPKDLALVAYGFGCVGAAPWRWDAPADSALRGGADPSRMTTVEASC